jgi:acyl carrier protein
VDVDVTEIIEIVAIQLDVAPLGVSPVSRLIEDLGAQPLALAQMILALEERFEIFIPDEDIVTLVTVRDVVRYVEALVQSVPAH